MTIFCLGAHNLRTTVLIICVATACVPLVQK